MFRFTILTLLLLSSFLAYAAPGDSLFVKSCTIDSLRKICQLSNLKNLNISSYKSDALPAEIGQLQNLESLTLSWECFDVPFDTAYIPNEIGRLSKLTQLDIHSYSIQIDIPAAIGALTELRKLHLYNMQFDAVPEELGQLRNLEDVMLCGDLKSLPDSFANWKKIKSLYLAGNDFESMPICIYKMTALESLSVERCKMAHIGEELVNLVKLEDLNLSEMPELTTLPESICALTQLRILDITNTAIRDIPSCIAHSSVFEKLKMCDLLIEKPEEMNAQFGDRMEWDYRCARLSSTLTDFDKVFGNYTCSMHYDDDSLTYQLSYGYNEPTVIDEDFWLITYIKVPRGHTFELDQVYPLDFSCFGVSSRSVSIWNVNEYSKSQLEGVLVFKEIERRTARIYMRIYIKERDGSRREIVNDVFDFKKVRRR